MEYTWGWGAQGTEGSELGAVERCLGREKHHFLIADCGPVSSQVLQMWSGV